jgi:hypothetical protein
VAAIIIAKNVTVSTVNIEDMGFSLSPSGTPNSTRTLTDYFELFEIVSSDNLTAEVAAGNIVINDGTTDLSVSQGLNHIFIQTEYEDLDQDSGIAGANFDDILLTGGCGGTDPHIIATKSGYLVVKGGCS